MVLQAHGRYNDASNFDFMAAMGIWFENFALPVVVNECLLQSYNGSLRLFPNWPKDKSAEFRTLRAAGAFLVSAAAGGGEVQWVEIESEAGSLLRVILPWNGAHVHSSVRGELTVGGNVWESETRRGEIIRLRRM
jgi:hypothetical protein